jgi:type I restriction enzyme S subunit
VKRSWKYAKIGDVCIVERGGSPRPIDKFITDDVNGINWIKIGDATESMYITKTAQRIIPEGVKKSRYVKPGDFLLSNSMSFGRPYILAIDGCIHDGWLVLRDESQIFDKRFLYYYLSSKPTYEKLRSMAVGGVVNNLNSEMVRGVFVPVPDKVEQSGVADVLDKVKNIITLRKQEHQRLDELIKARFVEMFGIPGNDEKGWGIQPLGQCCEVNPKKSEDTRLFDELEVSFIPMGAVSDKGEIDSSSVRKYSEVKSGFTYFSENDVLFAKITPCMENGKGAIAKDLCNGIGFGTTEFHVLRPLDKLSNPYWLYTLTSFDKFRNEAACNMTGSAGQRRVPANFLFNYSVSLPPFSLQCAFADFVKQIDKSKVAIQKSLAETQLLFDKLMQDYFG